MAERTFEIQPFFRTFECRRKTTHAFVFWCQNALLENNEVFKDDQEKEKNGQQPKSIYLQSCS